MEEKLFTEGQRLIDDIQAARFLGCKPGTLRKWRSEGGGPAYRSIGRLKRYAIEDLEQFIERQRVAR